MMGSGPRTVRAEKREIGGDHGRGGRLREGEGAEPGTHRSGEDGRESADNETGYVL